MNQPAPIEQAASAHNAKRLAVIRTVLILLFLSSSLHAQTKLWNHVSTTYNPKTSNVTLTPNQIQSIHRLLRSHVKEDMWACGDDPEDQDWVNDVYFSRISLAQGRQTILVEAGAGCARGGQGSNGAMWIVEFHGSKPALLATPGQYFNGSLFSVQPTSHRDYHDIVLSWHMSASEAGLTYFRFNGNSYRMISSATMEFDDDGTRTIIPGHPASPPSP
jgi:hypothetical protein